MAPQRVQPRKKTVRVWVLEIKGRTVKQNYGSSNGQPTLILSNESTFLYGASKSSNGMLLREGQVDDSFKSWTGNFATRTLGYVLDEPPFIDAVGILNHGMTAMGRDFQATHDGVYQIRIGAYTYRANHGKVEPTTRTEVVAFYSDTRLLGHVDVTPQAEIHEIEVWLNAGEKVSVTAASLPLCRIEPKDRKTDLRYPIVDVPANAFLGLEMEGLLIDTWPPASHRRVVDELSLKPLDSRD